MFYQCESLTSIPDISRWNIKDMSDVSFLFANSFSLSFVPNFETGEQSQTLSMFQDVINCYNQKYTSSTEDNNTKFFMNLLFG